MMKYLLYIIVSLHCPQDPIVEERHEKTENITMLSL